MNLADIIVLAKQGYKKKDIEELIAMEVPSEEQKPEPQEKNEDIKEPEPSAAEDIDYRKLYEQSQSEIAELKKSTESLESSLKVAQQKNTKTDLSGTDNKSDEDILRDLIKNFG